MTVYSDRGEEQCIWGFSHHCFWHNSVTPIGHTKARGEKLCSPPALSSLDTWLSNSSLTLLHPPDVSVCVSYGQYLEIPLCISLYTFLCIIYVNEVPSRGENLPETGCWETILHESLRVPFCKKY